MERLRGLFEQSNCIYFEMKCWYRFHWNAFSPFETNGDDNLKKKKTNWKSNGFGRALIYTQIVCFWNIAMKVKHNLESKLSTDKEKVTQFSINAQVWLN